MENKEAAEIAHIENEATHLFATPDKKKKK
jgi:hypothetical protein